MLPACRLSTHPLTIRSKRQWTREVDPTPPQLNCRNSSGNSTAQRHLPNETAFSAASPPRRAAATVFAIAAALLPQTARRRSGALRNGLAATTTTAATTPLSRLPRPHCRRYGSTAVTLIAHAYETAPVPPPIQSPDAWRVWSSALDHFELHDSHRMRSDNFSHESRYQSSEPPTNVDGATSGLSHHGDGLRRWMGSLNHAQRFPSLGCYRERSRQIAPIAGPA